MVQDRYSTTAAAQSVRMLLNNVNLRIFNGIDEFGSKVFSDSVMREKLPTATYKALKKIIDNNLVLTRIWQKLLPVQ